MMSSPESSPSLFVQRLESSQVTLHYRLESSRVGVHTDSSLQSQIATKVLGQRFPNWLCGRGGVFFFGFYPISVGKQQLCGREDLFFGLHSVSVGK